VVAKLHAKVDNIRDHHHNKNASVVASRYRKSAIEEHGVLFMIRNRRLAKVATDRAIYKQKLLLKSKLGNGTLRHIIKQRMVAIPDLHLGLQSRRNSKIGYTTVQYAGLLPGGIT